MTVSGEFQAFRALAAGLPVRGYRRAKRHAGQVSFLALAIHGGALAQSAPVLPTGGQIIAGTASIALPSASTMVVGQSSARAVIDWQSFSIGAGGRVEFNNGSGAKLNRVTGGNSTSIAGQLNATGSVYVINPAGIVVDGSGKVVTGGSFVASTRDVTNDGFMASDRQSFLGTGTGTVTNSGSITTGGDAVLIGHYVANDGTMAAGGTAALASGTHVVMQAAGSDARIFVEGSAGNVTNSGTISAAAAELRAAGGNVYALAGYTGIIRATGSQNRGGRVWLSAETGSVFAEGSIKAQAGTAGVGKVDISASGLVGLAGSIDAIGAAGGTVSVSADQILNQAVIDVSGASGAGGIAALDFGSSYIANSGALIRANAAAGTGGTVAVTGTGNLFSSGSIAAIGANGHGGDVRMTADAMMLIGAHIDASGSSAGGSVRLGGDVRGGGTMARADRLTVDDTSTVAADATLRGDGGLVVLWSQSRTLFGGTISARGLGTDSFGGAIEVSAHDGLFFAGKADAGATSGKAGMVLIDPRNIIIANDSPTTFNNSLVDPYQGVAANGFGTSVTVLAAGAGAGNVVVTAPNTTVGGIVNAGAVYLFSSTGALLSQLVGGSGSDGVGKDGVTVLTNGNYVVGSSLWDNGTAKDAGALTWGSGTQGVSGVVSTSNSLVGSNLYDYVGRNGVTTLTNGNYVVTNSNWNSFLGAVTWGSGTIGVKGVVSASNSLVGGHRYDSIGNGGVTALSNGNYVVRSTLWDNFTSGDAGAVTWGSGTRGISGYVSDSNSLVGFGRDDTVGSGGVTALSNGSYVVSSPNWANRSVAKAGAVTWSSGTTAVIGEVSASNSLVGSTAGDMIGSGGVTVLSNGNYVVRSTVWDNGIEKDAGAVTWGSGTTGVKGVVSSSNSLVGSTSYDYIGNNGVTALSNGNYVVASPNWYGSRGSTAGAVTWGSGTTGVSGVVSASNSLVGVPRQHQWHRFEVVI
ncbi:filamentous hemagglutinin N-terminal domain-containing protein [Novosphingobium sp. Chol11]|uniref:beta strand repeat-containing protein n=1 Tax=Novosphingobium sp. Chol11 TaxID=1385763 RepID=UPI0025D0AFF7|nr:filamentous hemagglutinin N-terminal domain-containing protein [Novosphingobium sp. Chol11]